MFQQRGGPRNLELAVRPDDRKQNAAQHQKMVAVWQGRVNTSIYQVVATVCLYPYWLTKSKNTTTLSDGLPCLDHCSDPAHSLVAACSQFKTYRHFRQPHSKQNGLCP